MDNREAYNQWSESYDQVDNKTRDLEAVAQHTLLTDISFKSCLEIGCGTGKNTQWLASRSQLLTAVDFSEGMISRAKNKDLPPYVDFELADVTEPWEFVTSKYELISFSLILEHIEQLEPLFEEASKALDPGGYIYIGELHPYKQYKGSKARFETEKGEHRLGCFTHHISDYVTCGLNCGLQLVALKEFFVPQGDPELPQILGLLFSKGNKNFL